MKHIEKLRVLCEGKTVGEILFQNQQYWFQYDTTWLKQGFDLSPQTLPFNALPQKAPDLLFRGLHGIFYDSLPDGWGLLLMDRFFKQKFNWDPHQINHLDRLAYLGPHAMGALEYEPILLREEIDESINLANLAIDAKRLLAGKTKALLNQLRIQGGSPGGARPKITVALSSTKDECLSGFSNLLPGFDHWIVKFRSETDPKEIGRIEKTYADLAAKAGLRVPENRLIQVRQENTREIYFASKRFDREGNEKLHILSLCAYVYADFRLPSLDYNSLLAATLVLTKNIQEVKMAFRLMIFNILTHNKDDHTKNFTFIHTQKGEWQLAPAYDLTFSSGMNNQHTTAINGSGNPKRSDIQAIAKAHHITDWEIILEEVIKAVNHWPFIAQQNRVPKNSIKRIEKTLQAIQEKIKLILPRSSRH
jgi:serine/threonine-protein kinase HipA